MLTKKECSVVGCRKEYAGQKEGSKSNFLLARYVDSLIQRVHDDRKRK